nr:hypothetical protein [Tanacetum cinerariifolium]
RVRGVASLGYRGYLTMWRILHLEVLVGETNGPVKLEKMRRFVLGDDLECMMAASEISFTTLYTILNEFCVPFIMDTGQGSSASPVQTCQDGEADFVGLRTPENKILYWLESEKNSRTSDTISCPCIKIEHNSFVIDPLTNREAELSIDMY